MYELTNETEATRTYRSTITGTEINTHLIYTDGSNQKWWAFDDLTNIPFIRKKASEQITRLYGAGVSKEDIDRVVKNLKTYLKSTDAEKYEKAYSEVLQFEAMTEQTADPEKQSLGLCTVYILADDEKVDVFSQKTVTQKMALWAIDTDAQSFFLNWLTDGMNNYSKSYNELSQIASGLK